MKQITVRDIDDEVYAQLVQLAEREHRSVNGQVLVLLERGIVAEENK
jgi:hypothetical protein